MPEIQCAVCFVVNNCTCIIHRCTYCGNNFLESDRCEGCSRCPNCCHCVIAGCGCRVEEICSACNRCDECCECRYETDDSDDDDENYRSGVYINYREPFFHVSTKKGFKRNSLKRYLACEIEVDSLDSDNAITRIATKWKAATCKDTSLGSSGLEICTAPAMGDLFLKQIEEFSDALQDANAEITTECGLHVHADARDMTWWDLRRLILLYSKIEPALFSVVPHSRKANDNCRACADRFSFDLYYYKKKNAIKHSIIDTLYKIGFCDKRNQQNQRRKRKLSEAKVDKHATDNRYDACNIHSWFHRGSIELRLGAGTVDSVKIINWALLWGYIVDFAARQTDKDLGLLPIDSWDCLLHLAPSKEIRQWLIKRHQLYANA